MVQVKKRLVLLVTFMMMLLFNSYHYDHNVFAQTQEEIISQLAMQKFQVLPQMSLQTLDDTSYQPFEVSAIEVHNDWARVHITSVPEAFFTEDGETYGIAFQGAVAKFYDDQWKIIFDGTSEFEDIKDDLPLWLGFLNENQATTSFDDVSVPSLPWAFGESWKLNWGLHDSNTYGIDFGVGESTGIHAVDSGEVLYTNGTCIITERSDGLQIYYQHIAYTDVDKFETPDSV